jgi:hypothetical protein
MWMAILSGHRKTAGAGAAVAAVLLAVGPTLAASPALAAPGDPSVEFSGGSVLGAVVCKSQPSTGRLDLSVQSRVMFVNRLGESATLRIDGHDVASVRRNQAVPVVFHHGPVAVTVAVTMALPCSLGVVQQYSSVTVSVASKASGATPSTGVSGMGTASSASRADSAGPSPNGSEQRSTHNSPRAGNGSNALDLGGTEPAQNSTEPAQNGTELEPPALAVSGAAVAVEQPVAASGTPRNRASNLLALIAVVCVIGVTVAASRAIFAERIRRIRYA